MCFAGAEGCEDSIIQQAFGGLLRSDVVCRACGQTSTAFDPFLDLSLDLLPQLPPPQVSASPSITAAQQSIQMEGYDLRGVVLC